MKKIQAVTVIAFTIVGLIAPQEAAAKKIKRACEASYEVSILRIDGNPSPYTGSKHIYAGDFWAGCGGLVPNRCRRRARDAAHKCMGQHFSSGIYKPSSCTNNQNDYEIGNVVDEVKKNACTYLAPEAVKAYHQHGGTKNSDNWHGKGSVHLTVQVDAKTDGDVDCPKQQVLSRALEIDCVPGVYP